MKVLIADDEKTLTAMLTEILRQSKIDCDAVYNGRDAADYAAAADYDLIVLDVMMPKMNGFEALKEIRARKISTPVLFLSAKSEVADKVEGLNIGADDYLTKPFAAAEFVARVKALSRRKAAYTGDVLMFGGLALDKNAFVLRAGGNEISLSGTEFKIMELLMSNTGTVVRKERLIEKVWGWDNDAEYNNAEVYISFLRKKIAAVGGGAAIKSIRGVGYALSNNSND
ncbi:MAG: response regulator transcription factor [Clostridiales bacterium]|jgi:DNA-binding response OmpR family regulator|nr:response regulator transcription factor [Clostridiales bacterium]